MTVPTSKEPRENMKYSNSWPDRAITVKVRVDPVSRAYTIIPTFNDNPLPGVAITETTNRVTLVKRDEASMLVEPMMKNIDIIDTRLSPIQDNFGEDVGEIVKKVSRIDTLSQNGETVDGSNTPKVFASSINEPSTLPRARSDNEDPTDMPRSFIEIKDKPFDDSKEIGSSYHAINRHESKCHHLSLKTLKNNVSPFDNDGSSIHHYIRLVKSASNLATVERKRSSRSELNEQRDRNANAIVTGGKSSFNPATTSFGGFVDVTDVDKASNFVISTCNIDSHEAEPPLIRVIDYDKVSSKFSRNWENKHACPKCKSDDFLEHRIDPFRSRTGEETRKTVQKNCVETGSFPDRRFRSRSTTYDFRPDLGKTFGRRTKSFAGNSREHPDFNEPQIRQPLTIDHKKEITLRRHYYPEGGWGYIIVTCSALVHFVGIGLQLAAPGSWHLSAETKFHHPPLHSADNQKVSISRVSLVRNSASTARPTSERMKEESEEALTITLNGRGRHHRRHSYTEAMEEKNAIVEPDELTRRQSVVARWNTLNSKKKLTSKESHDSTSSSLSSSASIRPGRSRSVTKTPTSSATSRSSSINEIELPEVFLVQSNVTARLIGARYNRNDTLTDCTCRKDSLASASPRDSFSSYSIKRQDSGYSVSTCQSTLLPLSAKNSVNTLNGWQDGKVYQQSNSGTSSRPTVRRHSDQTLLPSYKTDLRRLSDQSLIRHAAKDSVVSRSMPLRSNHHNKISATKCSVISAPYRPTLQQDGRNYATGITRPRRPSLRRRDSDTSIQSLRRDSLGPVTPKMLRRRFSEQLILEGGFGNEPEFDDLVATHGANDPEESFTVANARKKVTLKRHYYPEGNWGYVVTVVAVIIHSICHGLQMGFGVLLLPTATRFDKKISNAVITRITGELSLLYFLETTNFMYGDLTVQHLFSIKIFLARSNLFHFRYIAQCTIRQHYYPESGWGWVVVVTGVMVQILAAGISGAAGIWLVEGMRKYRQPLVNVGWLGAMSTGVALLVSPVTIAFCRKKSTRVTAVLGGLVTALGCLFTSFASQFHQLFFSYGTVVGIGVGMTRDCSTLMVAQYFKRRREFVEIFIVSGSGLGIAVMSAFIKGAISKIGWRLGLQAVTGVVFLTFILGTFYRSASLYHPQRRAILHLKNQKRKIKDKNRADTRPPFFDFSTLKSKTVRILLISTGISAFGINTPIFYLAHQAEEEGLGDNVILLQTYLGLAWTLGCVAFGLLVVHHSVECRIARQYLTQAAVFMCGLCILALTAVHGNYHGYVMFTWIYGIFCGGYHYSLKMYTYERVRARNFARTWGFVQCSQAIPIAIGVPISGYINVGCGGKAGYYFSSTCVLVGSFTLFFIDLHRRNLSRHKHTRANGTRHLCVSDNCPQRRRLSFTQDPENEGVAAGAAAAALVLGAELAPGQGEIIDALGAEKPELTCISEEGIADMDLPDNLLDDLDYIGDCITSCNKVENYLMLSEFENNLIAEMPIIMDRKGRRWSLARSRPGLQGGQSVNDNGNGNNGNGQSTTAEEDEETKLKWHLAPAPNHRVITVIDEAST